VPRSSFTDALVTRTEISVPEIVRRFKGEDEEEEPEIGEGMVSEG